MYTIIFRRLSMISHMKTSLSNDMITYHLFPHIHKINTFNNLYRLSLISHMKISPWCTIFINHNRINSNMLSSKYRIVSNKIHVMLCEPFQNFQIKIIEIDVTVVPRAESESYNSTMKYIDITYQFHTFWLVVNSFILTTVTIQLIPIKMILPLEGNHLPPNSYFKRR